MAKRQITAKPLTLEGFATYGRYAAMSNPQGVNTFNRPPVTFSPDLISLDTNGKPPWFSVCCVSPRPPIIKETEVHSKTEELYYADKDTVIHVGPPTADNNPPLDAFEAFHVPAHTLVVLKRRVWHHAGYTITNATEPASIVIGLPACTYHNDCDVVKLGEDDQIEIAA